MEFIGRSASHFIASPIKEYGNNQRQTDSWEIFLNENGPQMSTKFWMCSWGSSWASPPNNHFICKSWSIVLVTWKTVFPLAESRRLTPTPPNWIGSLTSFKFSLSSWWPILLPLLPFTLISFSIQTQTEPTKWVNSTITPNISLPMSRIHKNNQQSESIQL